LWYNAEFVGGAIKFYEVDENTTYYVMIAGYPSNDDIEWEKYGQLSIVTGAPRNNPNTDVPLAVVENITDSMPSMQREYFGSYTPSRDTFDWLNSLSV
jgi:hypothetical protein